MNEINRHTLKKSIGQLPEYEAPAALWDEIEAALEADEQIVASVAGLPQYNAPDQIWDNLESALNRESARKSVPMRAVFRRLTAVAAVGLVLLCAWWLFSHQADDSEKIVVSQELLNERLQAPLREQEDPAFQYVQTLCQSRAPICEQPGFKHLKSELDELTVARETLRRELGQYGDDPSLSTQLVRIEHERSDLLKQMMSMI